MKLIITTLFLLLISGCLNHNHSEENNTQTVSELTAGSGNPSANTKHQLSFTATDGGKVNVALASTYNLDWSHVYVKTNKNDYHFNLNQPAKSVDSLANNWTQVFNPSVSVTNTDIIYFCGPATTTRLQIADDTDWSYLYNLSIVGVPLC